LTQVARKPVDEVDWIAVPASKIKFIAIISHTKITPFLPVH